MAPKPSRGGQFGSRRRTTNDSSSICHDLVGAGVFSFGALFEKKEQTTTHTKRAARLHHKPALRADKRALDSSIRRPDQQSGGQRESAC